MNKIQDNSKPYELKLHPMGEESFIGTIDIDANPSETSEPPSNIEMVVILDRSGSMGDSVPRMANQIIPLFLAKLRYESRQTVYFITFDSKAQIFTITIERMKSLLIRAQGGTNMEPAIKKCVEIFEAFESGKSIRVLTISDGQVGDQKETAKVAGEFSYFCSSKNFSINSQAVRFFTSEVQPDTTALCSLLQINNVTKSKLADISSKESNEVIATKIAELFINDGLTDNKKLKMDSNAIMKFPWESSTAAAEINLNTGKNLFWMKEKPPKDIKIDDIPVEIKIQPQLTLKKFQALMVDKLDFIVNHMKVLKVVGTEDAKKAVLEIIDYFKKTESDLTENSTLVKHFKVKALHKNKISDFLTKIAENEEISELNSAQRADYLRESQIGICENPPLIDKIMELDIDVDSEGFKKAFTLIFFLILAMIFAAIRRVFFD